METELNKIDNFKLKKLNRPELIETILRLEARLHLEQRNNFEWERLYGEMYRNFDNLKEHVDNSKNYPPGV